MRSRHDNDSTSDNVWQIHPSFDHIAQILQTPIRDFVVGGNETRTQETQK